jgi:hypothetical protein
MRHSVAGSVSGLQKTCQTLPIFDWRTAGFRSRVLVMGVDGPGFALLLRSELDCGDGRDEDTRKSLQAGSNRNTLNGKEAIPGYSSGNRAMTTVQRTKCDCCALTARPFNDKSRSKVKLTHTIRPMRPTSRNAEEDHMAATFRGTRALRFLWYSQRGFCPVRKTRITLITGWRLHYRLPRVMGGPASADMSYGRYPCGHLACA